MVATSAEAADAHHSPLQHVLEQRVRHSRTTLAQADHCFAEKLCWLVRVGGSHTSTTSSPLSLASASAKAWFHAQSGPMIRTSVRRTRRRVNSDSATVAYSWLAGPLIVPSVPRPPEAELGACRDGVYTQPLRRKRCRDMAASNSWSWSLGSRQDWGEEGWPCRVVGRQ